MIQRETAPFPWDVHPIPVCSKSLCTAEDESCPTLAALLLVSLVAVVMDLHCSLHLVYPWDQGHEYATQPAEVRDREQSEATDSQ